MNYARAAAGALLLLLFATFDAVAIQTHLEVVKLGAYALASVTGTALVYLTGWRVPRPGQVVVVKFFPTGSKDKPRFPTYKGFRNVEVDG